MPMTLPRKSQRATVTYVCRTYNAPNIPRRNMAAISIGLNPSMFGFFSGFNLLFLLYGELKGFQYIGITGKIPDKLCECTIQRALKGPIKSDLPAFPTGAVSCAQR